MRLTLRFISCTCLPSSVTSVNADIRTSHEAAGIAHEEDGRATELGRVADAAKHVLAGPLGLALGVYVKQVLQHFGLDVAGRQGVDADAVLAPFSSQAAGELQNGRLGGVVDTGNVGQYL